MVIRNFLFHRVSDEQDKLWPPMKPDLFERVIQHLATHFTIISLESFLEKQVKIKTQQRPATILFDDGYKDNIEYAAPILEKYKCPASFYVVTDCIDRNIPTWTYLIDYAFRETKNLKIDLDFDFVPVPLKILDLNEKKNRKAVKPWMKTLENSQRVIITNSILNQCDDVPLPAGKMMSWDDVRQLSNSGFTIGSHSHTHPLLGSLKNEEEIKSELEISFDRISSEVQQNPVTISYPIGSFDERVKRISSQCGYKYGLAVEQKFYHSENCDLFSIPRVELYQEPWWKTKARISGIYGRAKQIWG